LTDQPSQVPGELAAEVVGRGLLVHSSGDRSIRVVESGEESLDLVMLAFSVVDISS